MRTMCLLLIAVSVLGCSDDDQAGSSGAEVPDVSGQPDVGSELDCQDPTLCVSGQCQVDDGQELCVCDEGWTGSRCDECAEGFAGPDCAPCSCVLGACVEDGTCACDPGYQGAQCTQIDPSDPPESMRIKVEKQGVERTLVLDRYNVRAGGTMPVKVVELGGANMVHDVEEVIRTYRGYCEEEPDASVSAMVLPSGGFRYQVFKGDPHEDWGFIPREEFEEADLEIPYVAVAGPALPRAGVPMGDASFTAHNASAGPMFDQSYRAHIGLIVNKSYLDDFGYEDPALVVRKVESTIARMNNATLRDALIETVISGVVIRTDRDIEWENGYGLFQGAFADIYPNTVMTLTNERGSGLTYVCITGGEDAEPSINAVASGKSGPGDDGTWYGVMRHEYGHSLGSGHYEGGAPEGPTIMSGNSLSRFSGYEVQVMVDCRQTQSGDAARFNESLGHYQDYPVPPYARVDDRISHLAQGGELTLDVMANDHDVNGDDIAIAGFEERSGLGGVVTLRPEAGPDARDTLVYMPPEDLGGGVVPGQCPVGAVLSDDCQTCVPAYSDGGADCSQSGECGQGEVCVAGQCRVSPGCQGDLLVNACGQPCPHTTMMLWLDGADLTTMQDTLGFKGEDISHEAEIASWADRSGQGHDAIVYAEARAPEIQREGPLAFAGRSTVRFVQDFMEVRGVDVRSQSVDGITSFAVMLPVSGSTLWVQKQNGFEKREHTAHGLPNGALGLTTMVVDGETERHWGNRVERDGSPVERALMDGGPGVGLGALLYSNDGYEGAYHQDFTVAELIVYQGTLPDEERAFIESYLVAKWEVLLRDRFWYSLVDRSGLESRAPVFIDLE